MTEEQAPHTEEQERTLQLLRENIDLLTGKHDTRRTEEVVHEGEEPAEKEFSGVLFLGELGDRARDLIEKEFEVDLTTPDFQIDVPEDDGFQAWKVPEGAGVDPADSYLLIRKTTYEVGTVTAEVLLYERTMLDAFEMGGWKFSCDLGELDVIG